MSDAEVLATAGGESKNGEEIIRGLPPWMAKDPGSGNYKLLDVVGRLADRIDGDINDVDNATNVQTAESVPQLERLAALVDLPPKEGESLEKYRTRTTAEFQKITSEGTISNIIGNTSILLDIDPEKIGYEKPSENGAVILDIPENAVQESPTTGDEIATFISSQAAAGFRIQARKRGTFEFLAESAYSGPYDSANGGYDSSQLESDASVGYDGLDADGNPKGNGGTYAGLIN